MLRPAEEVVWPASATASCSGWMECRGRGEVVIS